MVQKDTVKTITKRAFLFGGLALGGGLVVGYAYLRDKGGTAGFENWGSSRSCLKRLGQDRA